MHWADDQAAPSRLAARAVAVVLLMLGALNTPSQVVKDLAKA